MLGQSLSPGWAAKATGLGSLGKPQLVDGYANGWLITPTSATFDVSLDWTAAEPGLGGHRDLRRRVAHLPADGAAPGAGPAADRSGNDPLPGSEAAPVLISPLARDAGRVPIVRGAIAVLVSAGLAFALITPVAGLVVLAMTVAALLVPRGRLLLRIGSVAALAASAAYVFEVQARYNLPETGQWVQAFHRVATISWLAAGLIVADVLVGWARRDDPPRRLRGAGRAARAPSGRAGRASLVRAGCPGPGRSVQGVTGRQWAASSQVRP